MGEEEIGAERRGELVVWLMRMAWIRFVALINE